MSEEFTRNIITFLTNKQQVIDPTQKTSCASVTNPVGSGVPSNYIVPTLKAIQQQQQQQQKVQSKLPEQQFGTYKKPVPNIKTAMKVPLKKHQKRELDAVKELFR